MHIVMQGADKGIEQEIQSLAVRFKGSGHRGIAVDHQNLRISAGAFQGEIPEAVPAEPGLKEGRGIAADADILLNLPSSGSADAAAALRGLVDLVEQAGATLCGAAIAIEKRFQGGGDDLRSRGISVESLAMIERFEDDSVVFQS